TSHTPYESVVNDYNYLYGTAPDSKTMIADSPYEPVLRAHWGKNEPRPSLVRFGSAPRDVGSPLFLSCRRDACHRERAEPLCNRLESLTRSDRCASAGPCGVSMSSRLRNPPAAKVAHGGNASRQ